MIAPFAYIVPHGSEISFGVLSGSVTIRHPKYPTVRLRPKLPASGRWWLSAIRTEGQRLELRR